MPVPRTRAALEVLTENVAIAQAALPVPLALEHVAALIEWPEAEMDEATFLCELLGGTGAQLLLDVSNLLRQLTQSRIRPSGLPRASAPRADRVRARRRRGRARWRLSRHARRSRPARACSTLLEELCMRTDAAGLSARARRQLSASRRHGRRAQGDSRGRRRGDAPTGFRPWLSGARGSPHARPSSVRALHGGPVPAGLDKTHDQPDEGRPRAQASPSGREVLSFTGPRSRPGIPGAVPGVCSYHASGR